MDENETSPPPAEPRWQPLGAIDRRVVGVLAEKAKTTPDAYPMSLNAICTGCNQKSNRHPMMQLEPDDVEESLDRLREFGAVGMIEGYGRVTKYRHYLYDWLGVEKVELAVMTELLLRGPQTVGDLRGRAARMEPIADLQALRPILESLKAKRLVISLTAEGRGHVVTHGLHQPGELQHLRTQYSQAIAAVDEAPPRIEPGPSPAAPSAPPRPVGEGDSNAALQREIGELRSQLAQLQSDVQDIASRQRQFEEDLGQLRSALE